MKILITGGAGYIGSHTIIDILENTNWEVISIDNFSNSTPDTYNRIEQITGKAIKNYNVDLRDLEKTQQVFNDNNDITGIIHFAAFKSVPESVDEPLLYHDNNNNSLINILKCQQQFKVPYLIFSSSCSVYGNIDKLPVTENTILNKPESPYAYTKQIGESIVSDFIKVNPTLKVISLRYFNPVGAHKSGLNGEVPLARPNNLLPFITQTAIGKLEQVTIFGNDYNTKDGTCVRDYIHVSDIASAHVAALKTLFENANFPNYDVINLGSGNGVSVLEIINAFEQQNNIKLNYKFGPRRQGDVESIYSDSSKALKVLGWKTNYNINDMVKSAWLWEQNLNNE